MLLNVAVHFLALFAVISPNFLGERDSIRERAMLAVEGIGWFRC